MKKLIPYLFGMMFLLLSMNAYAVPIDLSGASSGSYIDVDGAAFAQSFIGQTIAGIGIIGDPEDPLSLNETEGLLSVAFWNGSNSILPQPNNTAPLSILFDVEVDEISWTMGYAQGNNSSVTIDFFAENGALVSSQEQVLTLGYNSYSYSNVGDFRGLTIYNNNDGAGLRYQDFDYEAATASAPVPEPSTILLMGAGLLGLVGYSRKRSSQKS